MRRIVWTIFSLWLGGTFIAAAADTYPLTDGQSMTGDVISYNDNGVIFRQEGDKYSERVPWTKFTQDALKQLSSVNPKIRLLAEPFIEAPPAEHTKKSEVKVHEVTRLNPPPRSSLLYALFNSSVGLIALMLIYAANIFAAYEIAVCRSRPMALMLGVSVVLPILGPIIFLAMPVHVDAPEPVAQQSATASQTFAVPGSTPGSVPAAVTGIHIAEASWQGKSAAAPAANPSEPQIFQRGQYTFNRRFFETKFSGFFAMIRREADRNLVLTVKTGRASLVVERITRIATNEMHVELLQGAAKQEIMVPFAEVVEVQLKSKSA